ncbi:hypothetical protein Ocin01_02078 [Orchesella cincta]|uniref:Uncharacterized protein n=1 Tax=Orchesella cincta TaxID=48709 RepID=A0A1D2NH90_ORCCI|nr:hypothetical protein Ocin01_02078 [Orchesella cincta]
MANANLPPDDIPLVLKTTSMYKVFQEVDALLEEAYSLIGKRPVTNPYADESDHTFAMVSSPNQIAGVDAVQRTEAELTKQQKEHSDSYDTAGSEIDEQGNIKLKKKTAKVKAKTIVKSSIKRQPSKSPAKGRNAVNTTKGKVQFVESDDDGVQRQTHKSKSGGVIGGDADNAMDVNSNKIKVVLSDEQSPRQVRNRRQNN